MGYACPVCEEPQADAEHLANHLAFSAMLGRADHADWLDEHAPGWGDDGPEELAERVAPEAEEVELEAVTGEPGDLPDPPGMGPGGLEGAVSRAGGPGRERLDPETREVIAEARDLTRRRREGPAAEPGDDGGDAADDEGAGEGSEGADGAGDEKG